MTKYTKSAGLQFYKRSNCLCGYYWQFRYFAAISFLCWVKLKQNFMCKISNILIFRYGFVKLFKPSPLSIKRKILCCKKEKGNMIFCKRILERWRRKRRKKIICITLLFFIKVWYLFYLHFFFSLLLWYFKYFVMFLLKLKLQHLIFGFVTGHLVFLYKIVILCFVTELSWYELDYQMT